MTIFLVLKSDIKSPKRELIERDIKLNNVAIELSKMIDDIREEINEQTHYGDLLPYQKRLEMVYRLATGDER
jgi:hypothetical protein